MGDRRVRNTKSPQLIAMCIDKGSSRQVYTATFSVLLSSKDNESHPSAFLCALRGTQRTTVTRMNNWADLVTRARGREFKYAWPEPGLSSNNAVSRSFGEVDICFRESESPTSHQLRSVIPKSCGHALPLWSFWSDYQRGGHRWLEVVLKDIWSITGSVTFSWLCVYKRTARLL